MNMVRTVRSIEEEASVRRTSSIGADVFLARPEYRDALEGRTIKDLLEWSEEGVRRVLVVGLEDRGHIALSMATSGKFVTVVEPDESLLSRVSERAGEVNCSGRMNFYPTDYMKKAFSSSGFDMVVFFSTLSSYNHPVVVVKKATRELRAGGKVFVRMRVRPSLGLVSAAGERLPAVRRFLDRAGELASRLPGVSRYLERPDSATFMKSMDDVVKVEHVEYRHIVSSGLGLVGARLSGDAGDSAADVLEKLARAEDAVLKLSPMKSLATYMVIYGTKELGLGKAFRV